MKKIKQSKYNLSSKEQKLCHEIIHSASVATATVGAGLAQLPLADNAVITPIQVTMIISLGQVFEQKISKTIAKSLLTGFIANFVGRGVSQAVVGWIPGVGNVSNAVTAAAITESIGWLSVDYFYKEKYFEKETKTKVERKENTVSYERPEGQGFAIIKKTCEVVKDGEEGILVWDYLITNEISFVNNCTKKLESLFKSLDDEKTEKEFNRLVQKYSKKEQSKEVNVNQNEDNEIDELIKLAEQFIKGEKNKRENQEEYKKCLTKFDILLDGRPEGDSIRELYSEFLKF